MKAAVYYETGAPEVLKYEDVPDPACPPNGVLVDVKAISIEGGDTLNRGGGDMPRKPHIVGYQAGGVIREVGPEVSDLKVGQAVVATMAHGSHAAMFASPAYAVWPIPEGADITAAACVPVAFGTADDCLFEFGHLQKGESVLIQAGASGVGLAAIQLAKRAGATVLATASSSEKLDRLKEYGLDHGINYREEDFPKRVRELTEGKGVSLVVDSVGGQTLRGSIASLAYRGRAITVGHAGREGDSMIDARALMQGNQSLSGVFLGAEIALNSQRTHPMIQRHIDDVSSGKLKVVVDRTFPLAEAGAAHAYIESRQAFGRVVLVP